MGMILAASKMETLMHKQKLSLSGGSRPSKLGVRFYSSNSKPNPTANPNPKAKPNPKGIGKCSGIVKGIGSVKGSGFF
jgi:hypothetical protein